MQRKNQTKRVTSFYIAHVDHSNHHPPICIDDTWFSTWNTSTLPRPAPSGLIHLVINVTFTPPASMSFCSTWKYERSWGGNISESKQVICAWVPRKLVGFVVKSAPRTYLPREALQVNSSPSAGAKDDLNGQPPHTLRHEDEDSLRSTQILRFFRFAFYRLSSPHTVLNISPYPKGQARARHDYFCT